MHPPHHNELLCLMYATTTLDRNVCVNFVDFCRKKSVFSAFFNIKSFKPLTSSMHCQFDVNSNRLQINGGCLKTEEEGGKDGGGDEEETAYVTVTPCYVYFLETLRYLCDVSMNLTSDKNIYLKTSTVTSFQGLICIILLINCLVFVIFMYCMDPEDHSLRHVSSHCIDMQIVVWRFIRMLNIFHSQC